MPRPTRPSPRGCWPGLRSRGGRGADRREGAGAHRRHPREVGRARRHRGFPARIFADHQGGLALMVLAEALLRVPDSRTPDALIEDKLSGTDWAHRATRSEAWLVSASPGRSASPPASSIPARRPEGILETLGKRLGLPTVRAATRQAMRLLGSHFVLGQTIEEALGRAGAGPPLPLFLRHARRGRPHRRRCRAVPRLLPRRHRRHRQERGQRGAAQPPGYLREALGAASALRGGERRAGHAGAGAEAARPRPGRQGPRPQLHRRCRGGGPARTVAGRDRRGAGRSLACRLGRLRPCRAGLSEAGAGGDRLARRPRHPPRPAG